MMAVAMMLGGAAAVLTGCDEDPSTASIYSEFYGWEDPYGYGGDWGGSWDDSGGSYDDGLSAGEQIETHLGNYVDYGGGVPWSTNDYGW